MLVIRFFFQVSFYQEVFKTDRGQVTNFLKRGITKKTVNYVY
jgi:hypothetical protein